MGGSQKTQTQQTQSNTIDPQSMAMLQGNYNTAQQNSASIAQPYTGQLTAGFTPTQLQAQGILSGVGTDPSYQSTMGAATTGTQGVLNSNPLSGANLQQFENPYQSDVINATMAQNERARQIAQTQTNEQNTQGSAFGGSRSGVSNALTNQLYDQNDQNTIANLNSQNYTQAQNAALAQGNQQLAASNQLGAQAQQGLGLAATQGGILGAVGDAQQGQQQTELTNAYQAFLTGKQLTLDQQNILNSALGMIPVQQTVNSSGTQTQSTNPGLGGILSSLGQIGMSVAKFAP